MIIGLTAIGEINGLSLGVFELHCYVVYMEMHNDFDNVNGRYWPKAAGHEIPISAP
jgi:hypothetical protein